MELTLVTQHYAPHFEGGTELVVRAQARELARLGHRVTIVAGSDAAAGPVERHAVDGLPVTLLPRLAHETYDLELDRPRLLEEVRARTAAADLVHVHHWSTLDGGLVRALSASRPVVVTLHDLFTTCPRFFRVPVAPVSACPGPGSFGDCARCCSVDAPGHALDALESGLRARHASYAAELAAAACIVVPSEAHAAALRVHHELPAERTRVVRHGLCSPVHSENGSAVDTGEARWGGRGKLRVLFLGHRSEVKGVLDLVRALAALGDDECARVELVLFGAAVEAGIDDALRAAAGERVALRFGGTYRVSDLRAAVRAVGGAHLAALPSRVSESYGLVVDEALALGLPVWVSDRGAPQERVGAAGRVLPAADVAAWRNSFQGVLARPDKLEAERCAVSDTRRTAADAAQELDTIYGELTGS